MAFRYTVAELQDIILAMAPAISECLNPDGKRIVGFAFVAFEFGPSGAPLAYVTNGNADDLKAALRELIDRVGTGEQVAVEGRG